ncbi:primosomal protein N', partial [Providencia alcalifaciens]
MIVVQVALPVPLNRTFDYLLGANMPVPVIGGRVMVPFGKRQALGVVVNLSDKSEFPEDQLKTVELVLDSQTLFPDDLWQLLLWSSQYYHYPIGEVLFHAMPTLLRQGKPAEFTPIWQWQVTEEGQAADLNELKRSPKQQQALALLRRRPVYRHQVG